MLFARLLTRPRTARLGIIAAATLAAAACTDPTTVVEDITADRPVLHVQVATGEAVLPTGTSALSGIQISNFDLTVPDAFDRDTETDGGAFRYYAGAACPCYFFEPGDFNNAAVTHRDDAPAATSVSFGGGTGEGGYVLGPEYWGAPIFDWWMEFTGLPASARVWIGLVRYGVQTAGNLDQAGVLLGQGVRAADDLVLAGGTPGGSGSRRADLFNTGSPFPAEPNANPYVFGYIDTNPAGVGLMDAVTSPFDAQGNAVYYTGAFDATQSPFGPNALGSFAPDQYNYIVIWSEDPLTNPNAPVVARLQASADLDGTSLNVRNNAFAPFPLTVTNTSTFKSLPGGANAFAVPGRITLDLGGLPTLASDRYQAFLYSASTNSYLPLTVTTVVDGETTEGVATFQGGEDIRLIVDASDEVDFALYNSVVISIEPAAGSATPSSGQFLYTEYLSEAQALKSGPLTLGSFTDDLAFALAGSGRASFFGDSLLVTFSRIPAPPAGFQYVSYLAKMRGPVVEGTQRLHVITLDELGNGTDRIAESELTAFTNFNTYVVVMEPIGSPGFNPATVLVSDNYVDKFLEYFGTE